MELTLTIDDINALSPATRAELLASVFPKPKIDPDDFPVGFDEDDFDDVVDLDLDQVKEFMMGCSAETIAGLKVFAEHGPVIHASLLDAADIDNYGHFQGRVTKRTRTITGDKGAFLFAWDDWSNSPDEIGQYAVTMPTYRSLRIYFELD